MCVADGINKRKRVQARTQKQKKLIWVPSALLYDYSRVCSPKMMLTANWGIKKLDTCSVGTASGAALDRSARRPDRSPVCRQR